MPTCPHCKQSFTNAPGKMGKPRKFCSDLCYRNYNRKKYDLKYLKKNGVSRHRVSYMRMKKKQAQDQSAYNLKEQS